MENPMVDDTPNPELEAELEAELAQLADGTLPAEREAQLRAQLPGSPQLTAALAQQRHAVSLLRGLDEPAPEALRARIGDMTAGRSERRRGARSPSARWRLPAIGTTLAAAAAAVVAVIVATGGGASVPTVAQTARLSLAAATAPAPALNASNANLLAVQGASLPFPSWHRATHWHASGARTDTLAGRRVVTVFYRSATGARIGYSIVAGAPLPAPTGAMQTHYGVRFTLRSQAGARVVTWREGGHTCVIAARSVPYTALVALALADDRATTT
jgi:hypothetical protein